jgi:ornithine carbamoyltransferase
MTTMTRQRTGPTVFPDRALLEVADIASELVRAHRAGVSRRDLRGCNIALVTCRARQRWPEFERAAGELGARVTCLHDDATSIAASARLLGQLYSAIDCEYVDEATVREVDRNAGVPVLQGLASGTPATRIVAMLLHLRKRAGKPLPGLRVVFAGDITSAQGEAVLGAAALAGIELALLPSAPTGSVAATRSTIAPARPALANPRHSALRKEAEIVLEPLCTPSDQERRFALQAVLINALG